MDNRFIGIMDSGVGGLTVAKYIKENYPLEGIIFIGDTLTGKYCFICRTFKAIFITTKYKNAYYRM
mgnify:CR=1 FL=1